MHKTLKILLATVFVGMSAAAGAAQAQTKIGFVDGQRLMQEAPQARAASQALEAEFGPRQKQLETQRKELEAKLQKFERDQATMAEAERTKQQRDLRDQQVAFERRAKEFQEDGQLRQNEELQRVQRVIFQEVSTYAKAQGYDLVLAQGVIYRSDAIDITNAVLQVLEKRGPTAGAAPAAGGATTPAKPAGGTPGSGQGR